MADTEIMVPLDGSVFAERALDIAVETASALDMGVVLYAAVVDRDPGEVVSDFDQRRYEPLEENVARRLERAQTYLDQVSERLHQDGVAVRSHATVTQDAALGIVEEAERRSVRMIVMTSHARSGVARWLLGSVAERVLRSASNPVLVVPGLDQR